MEMSLQTAKEESRHADSPKDSCTFTQKSRFHVPGEAVFMSTLFLSLPAPAYLGSLQRWLQPSSVTHPRDSVFLRKAYFSTFNRSAPQFKDQSIFLPTDSLEL